LHLGTGRVSHITILFADCRGFTALMHERGPEFVRPLIDELFRRSGEIVAAHDGIVDRFLGDAVMAMFNVPILRENHVEQAISAATQIQLAASRIKGPAGEEGLLKVGVGIATGYAFTGKLGSNSCGDYTAFGDVANIASRLQGHAEPGEIIVHDEVYGFVKSGFPHAREIVLQLKGIKEPVRAYSLT
jgi:adenylate cyclase